MADILRYDETIILPENKKTLKEMIPQSVVFIFNDNTIPPIACTLEYLYAQTKQKTIYPVDNIDKLNGLGVYVTEHAVDGKSNSNTRMWSFRLLIQKLIFKYGLKREYYKNIHGKWIDMGTVRPHVALLDMSKSIFSSLIGMQTINELHKDTSLYVKLCDNVQFSSASWSRFRVKDLNDIPRVEYITKDSNNNDGVIQSIRRGDGTYDLEDVPVSVFNQKGQTYRDNIHTKDDTYANFTVHLGNYSNHTVGSGNIKDNDHHNYNDLYIEFTKADGKSVFTDLDNMFIVCNNMIVDYKRSNHSDNAIFIPNVVKYAEIQRMATYNNPKGYLKKTVSPLQLSTRKNAYMYVLDFDIPNTEAGYFYKFDIRIYKWNNVSVSHFTEPLTYRTLLKTTKFEPNKMMWLKIGADFSKQIDKSRTILLCGNEIVPSKFWEVDANNPRRINFLWMDSDFDVIYAEMRRKYMDYMAEYGKINDANRPKIEQFVDPAGKYFRDDLTPAQRFEEYTIAIEKYIEENKKTSASAYDIHYMPSIFDIVAKQFRYKQFAVVTFDTLDEANYTVELYENHDDIEVDKPYTNYIRNINWSPDDILVVNGLVHTFVNEYSDAFTPALRWYLPKLDDVFNGADVYKLQVKRRNVKSNFYMKLNYTELLAGPLNGFNYYLYNEIRDIYTQVDVSSGFDASYVLISSDETFDKTKVYFVKNAAGDFVRVSPTVSEFEPGISYYSKVFNKVYYVMK